MLISCLFVNVLSSSRYSYFSETNEVGSGWDGCIPIDHYHAPSRDEIGAEFGAKFKYGDF